MKNIPNRVLDMYDQWIRDLLSPDYQTELTHIKLSTPFFVKSRCKKCSGFPDEYFSVVLPDVFFEPKSQMAYKMDRFFQELSFIGLIFYTSGHNFKLNSIKFQAKSYNPRLHKSRGIYSSDDRVEFLTCKCGLTCWAFNQKSVITRPEISQRKSKKVFPKKLYY